MLDIISSAKEQNTDRKTISEIECVMEFALGGIAEDHYVKSKQKDWSKSYSFAASILSPENDPKVFTQLKNDFPSILELPKHPLAASTNHFLTLMKSKDPEAIIQAFVNIERVNYKRNPTVSKWARTIMLKLIGSFNQETASELVIPSRPEDIGLEDKTDEFVVDMKKLKKLKVASAETLVCKCPECGLEIESSGRACETIECPRCPGVYLKLKDE